MSGDLQGARDEKVELEVRSDLLGAFTVRSDDVVDFPGGLLGFPECRRFALVRAGTDTVFWLQSLDYTALVFLLVDPFTYFKGYAVDVSPADVVELKAERAADIALLTIVTLPSPGAMDSPTANLQGPIAMNLSSRVGKQIICADSKYGVRCPFELPVA